MGTRSTQGALLEHGHVAVPLWEAAGVSAGGVPHPHVPAAGVCAVNVPHPPVPAVHMVPVPLKILKRWLPRFIRRSHIPCPSRLLSLQIQGRLQLKGLKSGIKATVARLLVPGVHVNETGTWGWSHGPEPTALLGLCQE